LQDFSLGIMTSHWILLTRDKELFEKEAIRRAGGPPTEHLERETLWTDDYTPQPEFAGKFVVRFQGQKTATAGFPWRSVFGRNWFMKIISLLPLLGGLVMVPSIVMAAQ